MAAASLLAGALGFALVQAGAFRLLEASVAAFLLLSMAPLAGFWLRGLSPSGNAARGDEKHDHAGCFMPKAELLREIDAHLAADPRGESPSALIFCELSIARATMRAHGLQAEEHVIREAAARLPALLPEQAFVASAGRGSFLVFLRNAADPMLVLNLARDITNALAVGVAFEGVKIGSSCHSGVALAPKDGATSPDLLRSAELALVSAREQGTPGYGFFNPELAEGSKRQLAVQRAVMTAIEEKGFRLDFQPVYNIRSGELSGFEALIRLNDPVLGPISPGEFIPIAEQAGLINEIGAWTLDEACRVAAEWPPHLVVAINLSPSEFLAGALINNVRRALERHSLPSYRLEVEITEGTLMHDSELVLGQLRVLRDMGVAVALDDFGTGYSSLSYLWKFPFSKLKIDRSFVNALDETASAKGILRSIVKLGHGLGMTVTAEGIENAKQLSTLRDLGCDLAQGYLLDRPAHVSELAMIIMRNFAHGLSRKTRESPRTAA
ncbi:putative bifunctional diguanylate cyclase/phosphodiesterase [Aestuariivirga sp.]|uniref:putative bifunctional diguanylate cyclase/phosphodiesterase n=1 Tax=Aestuariivirga sp. TaxID=2650926 RepID=UPI00391C2C7D